MKEARKPEGSNGARENSKDGRMMYGVRIWRNCVRNSKEVSVSELQSYAGGGLVNKVKEAWKGRVGIGYEELWMSKKRFHI